MTIDISIKYITNQRGETFFTQRWIPKDPKALVILVHGFGDYSGRYQHVVNYFAKEGYAVATYDQRGHGRSDGKRGDFDSFEQLVEDLNSFVWETRHEIPPGTPVFLIAMSVGALIAVNFAVIHPKELDGLILVSPAFDLTVNIPRWLRKFGDKLVKLLPGFKVRIPFDPATLSRDENEIAAYMKDPFVFQHCTLRVCRCLEEVTSMIMPMAFRIRHPVLMIQSKGDPICSAEATHRFFMQISGSKKKFQLLEGNFHEPFNDYCRQEVLQEISDWIEPQLKGCASTQKNMHGMYEQRRLL